MSATLLLSGGLGYLGGRIAQALVDAGYTVRCGSRREQPAPSWLPQMQMVRLDWGDMDSLVRACEGVSAVVHLAAMNEIESARDPLGALRMNGLASLALLTAAQQAGVGRFVYFSTAHVYGAPLQGEIDETTLARPVHPYAITHRVAEDFVLAAHDQGRLDGVVFRLSNAFGAPMTHEVDRWTLLVNDLCRQAAAQGELRLNSTGLQLRDFVTLGDVARASAHVLGLSRTALGGGLFNLGGHAYSVLEMTERVARRWQAMTGKAIAIHRQDGPGPTPLPLHYHYARLRDTGFEWTHRFDQEIDATLRLSLDAFGPGATR